VSLRLGLVLYPFCAAAVAINLFLLFLMLQAFGLPALSPVTCVLAAIPLGIPATALAAAWVRRLIDEADRPPGRAQRPDGPPQP
jgi:hypothetical protein